MQNYTEGNVVNLTSSEVKEQSAGSLRVTKPSSMDAVNPMKKVIGLSTKLNLSNVSIIKKDGTKEEYNTYTRDIF